MSSRDLRRGLWHPGTCSARSGSCRLVGCVFTFVYETCYLIDLCEDEEDSLDDPESKDTTNKTATATPDTAGPRVPQPSPKVPGGHSQSQSSGTTNKTGMPQSPPTGAPAVKMTTSPPVAQYKGMTPMGMGGMPMGAMGGMPMGGMPRPMGGMPMGMGGMPMYR